jgi:hypothetical protein
MRNTALDKLTKKQRGYVSDIIKPNITGTQAALNNYDCKDKTVANAISTENLQKPLIKNAIQAELDRLANLNLSITAEAIEAGIVEIAQDDTAQKGIKLKALELLAEIKKMKSDRPDITAYLVQDQQKDLSKCSQEELTNELLKRLTLPMDKDSVTKVST